MTKVQMRSLRHLQDLLAGEGHKSKLKVMVPTISSTEEMKAKQKMMDEQEFTFEAPQNTIAMPTNASNNAPTNINISITKPAQHKLRELQHQKNDQLLRIAVKAGGCSGYQYEFFLDDKITAPHDMVTQNDVALLIDNVSAGFLNNAIIDFQKNLAGENFHIINPNATNSCGCGVSFSA